MPIQDFSKRTFQLWEYHVSHGLLLIRSPQGPESNVNFDLICIGVEYMEIPRFLRGLQICEPTAKELQELERRLGKSLAVNEIHILLSGDRRFKLVAAKIWLEENELDIFESRLEKFGKDGSD